MSGKVTFTVLAAAVACAAASAPLFASAGYPIIYLSLHSFFSHVCDEQPQRSFFIGGVAVAVCARCLGIYLGTASGALLSLWRRPSARFAKSCFWIAAAANLLDVGAETLRLHGNMPVMRLLLGLGFGVAAAMFVVGGVDRRGDACACSPARCKAALPPAE